MVDFLLGLDIVDTVTHCSKRFFGFVKPFFTIELLDSGIIIIFNRIFKKSNDLVPESSIKSGNQVKISLLFRLFYIKLFVILSILGLPIYRANAGIFSFVNDMFAGAPADASSQTANVANSQTMTLLQAAVNSDPNPSKGGGDITIVGGTALLPESGPSGGMKDSSSGTIYTYEVRQGDTISEIAKMFGVSVNTIVWGNDLKNTTLVAGQQLVILPVSGVKYIVKKGDTLKSIADKFKGDAGDIRDFNNLSDKTVLAVGDEIIIPDGEMDTSASSSGNSASSSGTKSTGVKSVIGSYPSYSGYYMRPIFGGVKTQGIHGYNAVDLADSYGTPIYAAAAGKVIVSRFSGWNGGYGQYIVISHPNGTQTLYGHLSGNIVSAGDTVAQGQLIGRMGNTGKVVGVTGVHLHFEIRGARNPF